MQVSLSFRVIKIINNKAPRRNGSLIHYRPLLTDDGAIFRLARQRRDLYRATAHHSVNKPTAHQAAEEAVRLWREEQT